MKILHTADVQLGAQFKTLGDKAQIQREQLKKTFHKSLELGVKEGVGLVLISGDLFDNNHPSYDLIEFVRGEIKYLAENNIQLAIVPGHHDCLDEQGVYNRERFDDEFNNAFIFRNPDGEVKEYERLDLAVLAKPNISNKSTKTPLADVNKFTESIKYKVIAAHGELKVPGKFAGDYHPIDYSEIETLDKVDYVALGHWGSLQDCSGYHNFKQPVWYSGSPELIAIDQRGSGNILIIEFQDGKTKVIPIRIGIRTSKAVELDLANFSSVDDLKRTILESADKDLILEVALNGLNSHNLPVNTEKLEEQLDDSFFHIRISDKSHLAIAEIPEYSDALIQGQFLKIMRKKIKEAPEDDKKIYEDALQIGLMELGGEEII